MIYFFFNELKDEVLKVEMDRLKEEIKRLKEEFENYKKVSQKTHSPVIHVETLLLNLRIVD